MGVVEGVAAALARREVQGLVEEHFSEVLAERELRGLDVSVDCRSMLQAFVFLQCREVSADTSGLRNSQWNFYRGQCTGASPGVPEFPAVFPPSG